MARRWYPALAGTALALVVATSCRPASTAVGGAGANDAAAPAAATNTVTGDGHGPTTPSGGPSRAPTAQEPGSPADATPATQVAATSDAGAEALPEGDPGRYVVATAVVPAVAVYPEPAAVEADLELADPNPQGAPLVLDVLAIGDGWLQVRLPVRPNGSTGWIRATDVALSRHSYRIEVRLAERELRVFDGDVVVQLEPIGVGRQPTPTPGGAFYLYELLRPADPSGPYGPYAFGLSGFSEALAAFNGGDGRLGIHGTNDPTSLGADSSSGCIRLANPAIERLAHTVPLGTPVTIRG